MKWSTVSLIALSAVAMMGLADKQVEENLRRLVLKDKVKVHMGGLIDEASFHKLADMDTRKIDADLAGFKIERVSDAFISIDGHYVVTFAKDFENKILKRVIFVYEQGKMRSYADDVVDISPVVIKTSKGSVSVAEGFLISN